MLEGALNRVGLPGKRPLRIDVPSTLPSIRMNASQMERVVVNLVENAIKYSPSGTPISVSARVTRDGELRLSIEDEGPGVPAADRERIFEPFFRNQMARKSHVPVMGWGWRFASPTSWRMAVGSRSLTGRGVAPVSVCFSPRPCKPAPVRKWLPQHPAHSEIAPCIVERWSPDHRDVAGPCPFGPARPQKSVGRRVPLPPDSVPLPGPVEPVSHKDGTAGRAG